ncbi:MAG TPA: hypothetical protein VJP45_11390 [Candidatus Limnocylindria bacterium]|nr:hypothetical protein [Candidatus Limnocylindria bacterium]
MTAQIERVCTAHPRPDGVGPHITIVDGAWAFCAGRGTDAHEWRRIEPTRLQFLGDPARVQESPAT